MEPGVEGGVCHVHTREVVAVHHSLELVNRGVDEERGVRASAAAPDDVGRVAVVPFCCFCDDARACFRGCDVCCDGVEALGFWVAGAFLHPGSIWCLL